MNSKYIVRLAKCLSAVSIGVVIETTSVLRDSKIVYLLTQLTEG